MTLESLYELIYIMKKGIYDRKELNEIFRIINKHKNKCREINCPCPNFDIGNYLEKFKERKIFHSQH